MLAGTGTVFWLRRAGRLALVTETDRLIGSVYEHRLCAALEVPAPSQPVSST